MGRLEKQRALTARLPPARDNLDFLRSTQRCIRAPQIPAFRRLDLFGIPWILSSEMGLFNGLRATRGQFYFLGAPSREQASQAPAAVAPKADPDETPRRAEKPWRAGNYGSRHRNGPIRHWDQTNATFSFWQENVDSARFLQIPAPRSRCRLALRRRTETTESIQTTRDRHCEERSNEAIHAAAATCGMDCFAFGSQRRRGI